MQEYISDNIPPYLLSLAVATGIGLLIGLEREFNRNSEEPGFGGIRTFPIMGIAGCLLGLMSGWAGGWVLVAAVPGLLLFLAVGYFARTQKGDFGLTTSLTLWVTFLLGAFAAQQLFREALAAAVVMLTLLTLKKKLHSFIALITREELYALVQFVVLALLILPFLPNRGYGPNQILNPYEIGWVVVLLSGIGFAGYLLSRFGSAHKGIMITALLGGLFSSTGITWLFSARSKENEQLSQAYAAGITLASSVMFVRVPVLVYLFNRQLLSYLLLACGVMAATGLAGAWLLYRATKEPSGRDIELGNPLHLRSALGFGALFAATLLLVYYADTYFGNQGLYLSGLIAGVADVDAISISMAKYARGGAQAPVAALVILIAMLSNTVVKLCIALVKGTGRLRRFLLMSFGGILAAGLAMALYVWLVQIGR